jgi:hypothetical protein
MTIKRLAIFLILFTIGYSLAVESFFYEGTKEVKRGQYNAANIRAVDTYVYTLEEDEEAIVYLANRVKTTIKFPYRVKRFEPIAKALFKGEAVKKGDRQVIISVKEKNFRTKTNASVILYRGDGLPDMVFNMTIYVGNEKDANTYARFKDGQRQSIVNQFKKDVKYENKVDLKGVIDEKNAFITEIMLAQDIFTIDINNKKSVNENIITLKQAKVIHFGNDRALVMLVLRENPIVGDIFPDVYKDINLELSIDGERKLGHKEGILSVKGNDNMMLLPFEIPFGVKRIKYNANFGDVFRFKGEIKMKRIYDQMIDDFDDEIDL